MDVANLVLSVLLGAATLLVATLGYLLYRRSRRARPTTRVHPGDPEHPRGIRLRVHNVGGGVAHELTAQLLDPDGRRASKRQPQVYVAGDGVLHPGGRHHLDFELVVRKRIPAGTRLTLRYQWTTSAGTLSAPKDSQLELHAPWVARPRD